VKSNKVIGDSHIGSNNVLSTDELSDSHGGTQVVEILDFDAVYLHETCCLHIRSMERIVREAIQIELQPNNINREDGFSLSRSWKPLVQVLRKHKPAPNNNTTPSAEP
jgi:hypothetical protein